MEGRLTLFENDKGDNAKRPDFTGMGEIDGVKVKASFWWGTTKTTGKKCLSGQIQEDKPRDGEPQKPRYGGAPQQPAKPASLRPPVQGSAATAEQKPSAPLPHQAHVEDVQDVPDEEIPF